MKVGVLLSVACIKASIREYLEEFVCVMNDQIRRKYIKTANVINMDENGVNVYEIIKRKVVKFFALITLMVLVLEKGP